MSVFKFKHFDVRQEKSAMKVGTDAMVLGALIRAENKLKGLDIGTGTGVLSLMLAQKNSLLQIDAIEIEPEAYEEARGNVEKSNYKTQIQVFNADFLNFQAEERYDLIFSNPPYFIDSQKSLINSKNTARHMDSLPIDQFAEKISLLLSEVGDCWLIFPSGTFELFEIHAKKSGLFLREKIHIFGKDARLKRVVGKFVKSQGQIAESSLQIRDENGLYTEQYKQLTADYHAVKL